MWQTTYWAIFFNIKGQTISSDVQLTIVSQRTALRKKCVDLAANSAIRKLPRTDSRNDRWRGVMFDVRCLASCSLGFDPANMIYAVSSAAWWPYWWLQAYGVCSIHSLRLQEATVSVWLHGNYLSKMVLVYILLLDEMMIMTMHKYSFSFCIFLR